MKNLTVLGSGDAFSSGGKFNTSYLVDDDESAFLIDCGVTTLIALSRLDYPIRKIKEVFISHFHGDHYGGIPFLIIDAVFNKKVDVPFKIYGPKGIRNMIVKLQSAAYPGTNALLEDIEFVEYSSLPLLAGELIVTAIPVVHAPPSNPYGLKFEWSGKSLGFSGDTEWTDNLFDLARNTELFILECNNYKTETSGHLSYRTILSKHHRIETKRLLLTHMSNDVLEREDIKFDRLQDGMEIKLW